jgi:hypothetical protein
MKIIFLDIDGVLNCERAYVNGYCKYVEWTWPDGTKDHHQSFAPWCKEYLNELIELTGAKIVISSTWRHSGIDFMRKVWEIEGMKGEIIGITPNFRGDINGYNIPRGCEIDYYLEKELNFSHINWDRNIQKEYIEKTGVENYIIIDDDSDMLYGQRNHFVHVLPSPRNKDGFNQEYFTQALRMLTLSVIDLNY